MLATLLMNLLKTKSIGAPSPLDFTHTIELDDHNRLVKGRHGWFLANEYDQYLGRALVKYGESGEIEHNFLNSLVSEGDCVVEVGANIGTHTVGLAKTVGPEGNVIAIEAQPPIFRILCANLALNGLNNVTPYGLGCGSRKKTMNAPSANYNTPIMHNSGGVSLEDGGTGLPVPIVTLDELLGDIPDIRLLKIDVEGMEQEVLMGAEFLIKKHRPFLYVENDRVNKSKSLIEWIMSSGYRLWWHIPPLFNPNNFFGTSENIYGTVASFNMICAPQEISLSSTIQMAEITDSSRHPFIG